ncbi:MAG: radical SAM protein [Thermoleophilia bacterium]
MKISLPYDAVIAVTYRCNARCLMCNIWQTEDSEDLDAAVLARLPDSLRYINISGGEPFLRRDLPKLAGAIVKACPKAQLIISTNGLVSARRVREDMARIRELSPGAGIAVSIDGLGATHDRVRGIKGAFDRAMELIEGLKADGMTNLRIAFTIVDENVKDYYEVYQLSRRLGIEFTSAVAQGSEHYFQGTGMRPAAEADIRRQLEKVAAGELASFAPKRWARAYFNRGLYSFAGGGGRPLSCKAADDFFFLSPAGTIYACNVMDLPLGNLRDSTFAEIWNSTAAVEARAGVAACQMGCWMVCTARSSMKHNPAKVAGWIAAGKLKTHLGKPVL